MGGLGYILEKWCDRYLNTVLTPQEQKEFIEDCRNHDVDVQIAVNEIGKRMGMDDAGDGM